MIGGPVRWHWLYRGYLILITLLLFVFWVEDMRYATSKHKGFYVILLFIAIMFCLGAMRTVDSERDPVMGHTIRWACILMLHIMLFLMLF
jgi:uncharacterized membrane protein YqjE